MLQDTITKIAKIEARLHNSAALGHDQRTELLNLLGQLKTEITELSKTHQEQAESIASFAEVSASEATRKSKNPQTLRHSIGGLQSSVGEFESTHPKLAAVVNRIASVLANMGI
jgi:chromosome segregation ATPase